MTEPNALDQLTGGLENQPPVTPAFTIPEEYASHGAFQGISNMDDLFKKVINQESLIGKKTIGIPDETSSPEEISKFNEAFGVPVNYTDYTLESSELTKNIYGDKETEVLDSFKQVLHKAGLNQKQALVLKEGYDATVGTLIEQQKAIQLQKEQEFESLLDNKFGANKETKIKIAQEFLTQNVSDNLKEYLPHILKDNHSLMLWADIANNIYPDLKPEDITSIKGGQPSGKTLIELNAEIQKVISSDEFQNPRNPLHSDAKQKWLELAKQIDMLKNK